MYSQEESRQHTHGNRNMCKTLSISFAKYIKLELQNSLLNRVYNFIIPITAQSLICIVT